MSDTATQPLELIGERRTLLQRFIREECRVSPTTIDAIQARVLKNIKCLGPYSPGDVRLATTHMLRSGILTRLDDGRLTATEGPVP